MLAIERGIPGDDETCVFERAEQDSADFRAAARQGEKRVHDRQPDIVQNACRGFDGERAFGHAPGQCRAVGPAFVSYFRLPLFLIVGDPATAGHPAFANQVVLTLDNG